MLTNYITPMQYNVYNDVYKVLRECNMTITGIKYKFMGFSKTYDHAFEIYIPISGENQVITQTSRNECETTVTKYPLTEEAVKQFRELIDKYGITDWIGKTPAEPKVFDDDEHHVLSMLTLYLDDGTTSDITFREVTEETGLEAADAFRKLFFSLTDEDKKISEEKNYPNLEECREIKEQHGPVIAVETCSFTMGMMYGSNEWYTQTVEKVSGKENTVLVTLKIKRGDGPEVTESKETGSDILSKVQEISDKENLPGWNYAAIDPSIPVDMSMRAMDFTANGWLHIYYDDSKITGCPRVKRTIDEKACKLGGKEVDRAISNMVNECVAASGAKVELSNANPFLGIPVASDPPAPNTMTAFMGTFPGSGMGIALNQTPVNNSAADQDGTWECTCGKKDNTGKFCSECGNPQR